MAAAVTSSRLNRGTEPSRAISCQGTQQPLGIVFPNNPPDSWQNEEGTTKLLHYYLVAAPPHVTINLTELKINCVQLKEEELLEIMNNQKGSLTIEEFNLVKPENLKVESEVESEISLNDDIPPRINLKINDVHTVKAEEEEEFYPGHIMDVPVKNIYVYEAFPSNSIKLETEDDTTKETLLLILPHRPFEDDITPVCESESLQVKEEPINNGCDNFDEVTDPLVSEGTNLIKLEDHKIKNEAESEILLNDDVSPQVNPNMKSNELRIKDFHTVKTKDGMVFYPCRVSISYWLL
ncbi:uncharacterized protein LOC142317971 [Lycorma delicatula]|uniref:uncharacterized protein LOC142317971 n=1 Tax=Lycorma delicatula TaxID=130591 RepID=UPI003F512924